MNVVNPNPQELNICLPNMKKTRDLIEYGYESFQKGTIKVILYKNFNLTAEDYDTSFKIDKIYKKCTDDES